MLACGKTGFGTGGSLCLVNHDVVTEFINGFLCNGRAVASCTMRAFGKTSFGTGGSLCLVNYDVVTEFINGFLCNLIVTSGAMLACGKACFCTGGSYCLVNHDVVAEFINCYCFSADLCSTYRAVNYALVRACLGTGCIIDIFFNCSTGSMAECLALDHTANNALCGLGTGCLGELGTLFNAV